MPRLVAGVGGLLVVALAVVVHRSVRVLHICAEAPLSAKAQTGLMHLQSGPRSDDNAPRTTVEFKTSPSSGISGKTNLESPCASTSLW